VYGVGAEGDVAFDRAEPQSGFANDSEWAGQFHAEANLIGSAARAAGAIHDTIAARVTTVSTGARGLTASAP